MGRFSASGCLVQNLLRALEGDWLSSSYLIKYFRFISRYVRERTVNSERVLFECPGRARAHLITEDAMYGGGGNV